MESINAIVEKVFLYKGRLIKNNNRYKGYIKNILKEHNIRVDHDALEAFVMGACDAMIYDIACSLGFTKQWITYRKRRKIINKLWQK